MPGPNPSQRPDDGSRQLSLESLLGLDEDGAAGDGPAGSSGSSWTRRRRRSRRRCTRGPTSGPRVSPTARLTEVGLDLTIGNVPFGKVALHDPVHNPAGHTVHNHFIFKALHLTRPGGVVAVLTSYWTVDATTCPTAATLQPAPTAPTPADPVPPSGSHRPPARRPQPGTTRRPACPQIRRDRLAATPVSARLSPAPGTQQHRPTPPRRGTAHEHRPEPGHPSGQRWPDGAGRRPPRAAGSGRAPAERGPCC